MRCLGVCLLPFSLTILPPSSLPPSLCHHSSTSLPHHLPPSLTYLSHLPLPPPILTSLPHLPKLLSSLSYRVWVCGWTRFCTLTFKREKNPLDFAPPPAKKKKLDLCAPTTRKKKTFFRGCRFDFKSRCAIFANS